jgi:hypothetical protein
MRVRKNPMAPLAAVLAGLVAGAAGTVAPHPRYGLPFGAAVFAGDDIALPSKNG